MVSVRINDDGSYEFVKEIHGDTISDVLSYVEYQPNELRRRYRDTLEQAVNDKRITAKQRQHMINTFNASMNGYTYHETEAV